MSSYNFFLTIPLGFERIAQNEATRVFSDLEWEWPEEVESFPGGLELQLPFEQGVLLNHYLRVPTRILMRLGAFEAMEEECLAEELSKISWGSFAGFKEVIVSSRSSELRHKKRLESFVKMQPWFRKSKMGSDLYLRFFRDQCTVSIDTTGEPLYKRGFQKKTGLASLRDTFAAGILQWALQGADETEPWRVVDPFVGSGVFLSEALQRNEPLNRAMSYQAWPLAKELSKEPVASLQEGASSGLILRGLSGFDQSEDVLVMAEDNLSRLDPLGGDVLLQLEQRDVLVSQWDLWSGGNTLVIGNPPYGERLKIKEKSFFEKSAKSLVNNYQPHRLALLVPRWQKPFELEGYENIRQLYFENNGIPVVAYLWLHQG